MSSGQDLWNEISTLRAVLTEEITVLKARGKKKAQCEAEYRKSLAIKMLKERTKDNPTPVTILSDICRGDKEIAALKLERDIAETLYEVCQQAIYKTKIEIGVLDRQMQAERKGL